MNASMVQSFADKTTADIFRERNTKAARQIPKDVRRVVQRKLKMLDAAANSMTSNRPRATG